jgi:NAD(P)-dependent dehydrogenase (short-subunit alcohol dehydrogenase family)
MKLAVVTGWSRGLGAALCARLTEAGFHVIDFSRSAPHPFSTRVDLASPSDARERVQQAISSITAEQCQEVLCFNNAGTLLPIGPTWTKDTSGIIDNIHTNFTSAILVLTEVIQHFRSVPGRKIIVNISSGAALKGYAGWSLYCASKAGMEGYIRALAVEESLQPHPFTPISVDPGVMDTAMQVSIREASPHDFPEVARFIKRKNDGGLAPADEVAKAILKLVLGEKLESGRRYEV